jgi:hypothetical protein
MTSAFSTTAAATLSSTANMHSRLVALKDNIEMLSKVHHSEVLRICDKGGVSGSENKNGVFINLTCVTEPIIVELETYLDYVRDQEIQLNEIEQQKKELATKYFK